MNKPKKIEDTAEALPSDESLTAAATKTRTYENAIAVDNARQVNGDVNGNIHIGDVHNHSSNISMLTEIQKRRDDDYAARININLLLRLRRPMLSRLAFDRSSR